MKNEIWKDIPNYEGRYQVSNLGRVKSMDRFYHNGRNSFYKIEEKMLKSIFHKGYTKNYLSKNGITIKFFTHRLVAIAFIPNPENKPQVNHKNGIKNDNRVENLEWCSKSDNLKHAYEIGLRKLKKGENSHLCKINKEIVDKIREDYKNNNISQLTIGLKYNISQSQFGRIVNYKNWNF